MKIAGEINFSKMEINFGYDQLLMFDQDQLQRSLEAIPLLPTIPPNLDFEFISIPTRNPFFDQTRLDQDPWMVTQISPVNSDLDFQLLWNECFSLACEDPNWGSIYQLPTTQLPLLDSPTNNPPNSNNDIISFVNNDDYLLNDGYNNDQTLSVVVAEGLSKKKQSGYDNKGVEGGLLGELDNVIKGEVDDDEYDDQLVIKKTNNGIKHKMTKSGTLRYEEIKKCFDMPISKAAKELNVGLTVLKKRCRELNIKRWPHRKIKSLDALISNVKELGMGDVAELLEDHRQKLHQLPEMELTAETKRLRQACFKANYKKRRALALLAP